MTGTENRDINFYRAFEERHRGSRELIKSRLEVYLPFVEPLKKIHQTPEILDLGCGRGEWLELLQQNGFQTQGIDLDEGMLSACKELKLNVCQADALNYLQGLAANSRSLISAFHVVEHISFDSLRQLLDEIYRVLKPGGLLILETPNSENLTVGTSSFYLDPTHQKPLPAQLLSFVVEYAGFERVKTLYLQETPELSTLQRITLLDVLNGVSPDYAVIAQKKATEEVFALFNQPFERSYGLRLNVLAQRYDEQVTEIQMEIQRLLLSRSWRITAPLRWTEKTLQDVGAYFQDRVDNIATALHRIPLSFRNSYKSRIHTFLAHARLYVQARPRLKNITQTVINRVPALKLYLEQIAVHNNYSKPIVKNSSIESVLLTPQTQRIYTDLKLAIKKHQEDK